MAERGIGSVESWAAYVEAFAKTRQVITIDLQAHGRTADIDRPMTHEAMADDIGALIAHLGLAQVDVMGYSLGGGVAIQTGLRHRERVRKLVVVSTPFARSASYPSAIAAFEGLGSALADAMKPSPQYQLYQKVAPRPQDFPRLLDKLGDLGRTDYDWTAEAAKLPPMLFVGADADFFHPSHVVEVYAKLGGGLDDPRWDGSGGRSASRLAIIPGTSHYDILSSPLVVAAVEPWLAAP